MNRVMHVLRTWLMKGLEPGLRLASNMRAPWSKKRIKYREVAAAQALLLPGDVLVSRTEGELTTIMIQGYFKHAALVMDRSTIVHATKDGVAFMDMVDFFMSKDEVAVLRPLFCTEEEGRMAAVWARVQEGRPYDYYLDPENDAYYCSELVYMAFKKTMGPRCPLALRNGLGKGVIEPEALYRDSANFLIVWSSVTGEGEDVAMVSGQPDQESGIVS